MGAIVGWSLRFRLLVLGIAAAVLAVGVIQIRQMPVDTLPEISPPYVEVQTEALGLSAYEVEQLVTVPLEADLLHGVPFLQQIHSESVPGLSSITMVFRPGTNLYTARQVVAERLTQAHALPQVSKPPTMLQPLSSANRLMIVSLSSKNLSLIQESVLARWTIRPRLLSVPGVANVAMWGQREQQLQVLVDPEQLHKHGVSLQQVVSTAGNALWVSPLTYLDASTPGTGGFVDTPNQRLGIQHVLPILSPDDLSRVVLEPGANAAATGLRLGDVATVVEDHQPLIGDGVVNSTPGLLLVIEKFPGADTLAVSKAVNDALDALQPGLGGMQIDRSVFQPADNLRRAIDNVGLALLLGFVLLLLVLGLLLNDWRATVVAGSTVVLSLVIACLGLVALGATLNALVIAGLVLAVVVLVDEAVVGFDGVRTSLHAQSQESDRLSSLDVIRASVSRTRGTLLAATLVLLAAVIPAFFIVDRAAAFAPALALPYVLAVAAALVVSVTLAPALCSILLAGRSAGRAESPIVRRLRHRHAVSIVALLRWTPALFIATGAGAIITLAAFGAIVAPRVATSPLPEFRQTSLVVTWDGPPGTSQPEMDRMLGQAEHALRDVPGIANVGGHVGRAITGDQIVGVNSAELWLAIDPSADYSKTVAAVDQLIADFPGLHRSISTYAAKRANEIVPGRTSDITVRVYGQELGVLKTAAADVRQQLASIGGVANATVVAPTDEPTLQIQVDLAAAEKHGLSAGDVRRAATTLLSGLVVGSLFEEQKVFDVVVWGTPSIRQNLQAIENLAIDTPDGGQVRLGEVATVTIAPDPSVIRREGVFRYVDVDVTVAGRDISAVAADITSRVQSVSFPAEYHAEVLGDYADYQGAQLRLLGVLGAALIAAFLLLQAAVNSWRLALMLFVSVPAACVGSAIAAVAMGDPSIGTLMGFFAVLALAARGGLLAVVDLQRRDADGEGVAPAQLALAATGRLGGVLTTTIAAAAAMLPIVLLGDRAGLEIVQPMAVVILGGLATTAAFDLLVLPILYVRTSSRRQLEASVPALRYRPAFGRGLR